MFGSKYTSWQNAWHTSKYGGGSNYMSWHLKNRCLHVWLEIHELAKCMAHVKIRGRLKLHDLAGSPQVSLACLLAYFGCGKHNTLAWQNAWLESGMLHPKSGCGKHNTLAWRLPRQHSTLPRNDKLIYDVWHTWLTCGGRLKIHELAYLRVSLAKCRLAPIKWMLGESYAFAARKGGRGPLTGIKKIDA